MEPNVLVVEDEPDLLELLGDLLDAEGFRMTGVAHPSQVAEVAARADPDVFLIDIMLSGASGIEVAQSLRSAGFARTPMIAMSASSTMVRLAADSGLFQETIEKPFDIARLLDLISSQVGAPDEPVRGQMLTFSRESRKD